MSGHIQAPRQRGGATCGAFLAVALLTVVLSFETQSFAAHVGYVEQLGAPLYRHWYFPGDTLLWMLRFDFGFNEVGRIQPWVHSWFAAERIQLSWAAAAGFALYLIVALAMGGPRRNSDLHGGARWATWSDVQKSAFVTNAPGTVLGEVRKLGRRAILVHSGSENVLAIGPPGEGKSDGIAVPTLRATWRESAIVFDPVGELLARTGDARKRFGKVLVFDPRRKGTVRFNPLAGIAVGKIDEVQTVLASYMLDCDISELSGEAQFFEENALELGTAVVCHVIELGMPTLTAAANYCADPSWKSEGDLCESLLKSNIDYVVRTASKFVLMSDRQRSPIVASLTRRLALFRLPDVAEATGISDFSTHDLRRRSASLYLTVRERDQNSLNPLMRMVLTRLLEDLTGDIPRPEMQTILLMLDEFPLLKARIIERKLATMRKYRIRSVLLSQTLNQIRSYYGPNESISGLCDVRVFFPTTDLATQQAASALCGHATRWTESVSHDRAGRPSRSVHEAARPLLMPSELADLKAKNGIIVYKKGEAPIHARPIRAYNDKRFS
jgi:type IV secretion system protein VirD4